MRRTALIAMTAYLIVVLLATASALFSVSPGWAPFPLPSFAAPIRIELAAGAEKREWLTAAVADFNATEPRLNGRRVTAAVSFVSSADLITQVSSGQLQPTLIAPASRRQIDELAAAWPARYGRTPFKGEISSLGITPLVALVAGSVAAERDVWQELATPGADPLHYGHAAPDTDESGLAALVLLAAGYPPANGTLTAAVLADRAFADWLKTQTAAAQRFPAAADSLTADMILRTGVYDVVITYEHLAARAVEQGAGRGISVRLAYPQRNAPADHPLAVLQAPWVSVEQQAAAELLSTFLRSEAQQQRAMRDFGIRPANARVVIDLFDRSSVFGRAADAGLQLDLGEQLVWPAGDQLTRLVEIWRSVVPSRALAVSGLPTAP